MDFDNLWPWGCIGMGIFLFIAGILISRKFVVARLWPMTEGMIRESSVHQEWSQMGGENRLLYAPKISYEYQVKGKTYVASRLALIETTASSSEDQMRRKCAQFPIGQKVTVYYDPNKPESATLRTSDPSHGILSISIAVAGVILLAVGFVRILIGAR